MDYSDTDALAPETIRADPVERLLEPQAAPRPIERTRLAVFFAIFLACHIALLGLIVTYGFEDPPQPEQEISVEIVPPPEPPAEQPPPEQPPPEQEKPKEAQKQPPPELDLKPAYDAPRAPTKETVDRDVPDKETKSPKVAPPSEQASTSQEQKPADAARATPAPAQGPAAEKTAPDQPDAEALEHARTDVANDQKSASPEPTPQLGSSVPTIAQMMARLEPIPDYKFAGAAQPSPVSGGTAKPNYLSTLYALIMPRFRKPTIIRQKPQGQVIIYIDTAGRILHQGVLQPSSSPELDAAAMAAVRAAAPFPPPPAGLPPVLFTYP